MKRPAAWQLEKQRTAKAMRALPFCAAPEGCKNRGMGHREDVDGWWRWLCVTHAALAQRAQRERT